jgi:hypothetical protein
MQLIRDPVSTDTIEAFAKLLEGAMEGRYVGAVIGVIHPRRRYTVHCIGEASKNPTFARGVVAAIDDELRHSIHGDDLAETTY